MGRILGWGSLQLCQSLVNGLYNCQVKAQSSGTDTSHFFAQDFLQSSMAFPGHTTARLQEKRKRNCKYRPKVDLRLRLNSRIVFDIESEIELNNCF